MPHCTLNDGVRLYYEVHGPPDAYPLVCINGLLMDTTSWLLQLPAFSEHFRVVLYDCRGQGQSDKPPGPYPQANHAQDLLELLNHLDIHTAHFVGLSNGGTVAMTFAAERTEQVNRLVLIDTFAYADALMRAKLESWLACIDEGGPDLRFNVGTPWVWSRAFIEANAALIESLREKGRKSDPEAARSLISGTLVYDIRHRLPAIQASTLILVGEEDVLTPPWYARELFNGIPNAQMMTVPGGGHALTIEQPTIVNALAMAFLTKE
jgi:3-oxoadipate enol-lactonase